MEPFHWVDGERTIVFGRGRIAEAADVIGEGGYVVLSTPRGSAAAPAIVERARAVHEVGPGRVDELAAGLLDLIQSGATGQGELLVALGGGRVIDVAKALGGADPSGTTRVAAIPTTLSGAEMTAIHRQVAGLAPDATRRVRPEIVLNDPAISASQPLGQLAESACNALGHAFEGPLTMLRNPVALMAAQAAVQEIARAFASGSLPREPPTPANEAQSEREARDRLALGALLAGYVIGSTHYGLHHIVSQTLVRFAGIGHGAANAIMLPHSLRALRTRFPERLEQWDRLLGERPEALATRIRDLTGATRLRDVVPGADEQVVERCAGEAAARPDLGLTPPPAALDELLALYRAAW